MSRRIHSAIVCLAVLAVASTASARDTFHDLDVGAAVDSDVGEARLLEVRFFMAGQPHPSVAKDLGEFTSNRRTNAFNKSDERACSIAFLSAVIALQERARKLGGDAVIDIKSITRHQNLESATKYRCVSGNVVANVVLTGRVVNLAK